MDFSFEDLTREFFLIANYSKGGFSFKDIKMLTYKEYSIVLKEAVRIQTDEIKSINETKERING
jgi:hypothetical protein